MLGSGWCLVDVCLDFSRKELTSDELFHLDKYLKTTNYACLVQYAYKQILLNNPTTRDSSQIKPHMSGDHLCPNYQRDGSAVVWDSMQYESAHKYKVKDV